MMDTKAALTDAVNEREKRNRQLACDAAAECIVLLKNDGALPIKTCKIAVFGAGASHTIKGGTGSGEVNVRHSVNVIEGLKEKGFTITTQDWIANYDELWKMGKTEYIKAHRKRLIRSGLRILADLMAAEYRYPGGEHITEHEIEESATDTCIYVISRQSGEGSDLSNEPGSFKLEPAEEYNIRICAKMYRRFILCINSGSPIDISPIDTIEGINSIVYMGHLGMEGGTALADILTGIKTPCGKLAVTWAKQYEDIPFGDEFASNAPDIDHALYKEGIYVGYRYFDSFDVEPRYPFGFGLSYTDFEIRFSGLSIVNTVVNTSFKVTNQGLYSGKEVVQLYVSCPQNGLDKEYQRLAAFGKSRLLNVGESDKLNLTFPLSYLSCYDQERYETFLEQGDYILRAGNSSRSTLPIAIISLPARIVLEKHKTCCASDRQVGMLFHAPMVRSTNYQDLKRIVIDPTIFHTVEHDYSPKPEKFSSRVENYLDGFSPVEKLRLCVGTGLFGEHKGFCTPGAVGHTTAAYLDKGIPNAELCDGPAGLRIQRRSTAGKNGKIHTLDASISLYEYIPDFARKLILGNPAKERILYQFVTGFPVEAMVAQSWNEQLAYKIGRAVADEMAEYGAAYWLAPALNIVRNPLCGRNYEYYSEDPLISGKLAAAVVRGVQEIDGCFATIKHFAANNQEYNRYFVSSDIDERTLRELYLRGFEIAVRESAPKAVMTAYNKINGIYCPNRADLCIDILRREWGYEGVVMTDWMSTGPERADEPLAIECGVDLIMPGGQRVFRRLKRGLMKRGISENALHEAAGRVLSEVLNEPFPIPDDTGMKT